jgi:dipeptidyl aminopeptidase/acylaminoacyl peptidase
MDAVFPYGHWPSPLDAMQVAAGKVSLSDICSDGSSVYWLESRPAQGGRVVFVRSDGDSDGHGDSDGEVVDLSPEGVSIRSRVYEYGGGACCLVPAHDRDAFAYVDMADQRIWFCRGGASSDGAWVVAVREVLSDNGDRPRRCIVALGVQAQNAGESILAQGHDFYGAPRLDRTTQRMAVVVWDHPDMPWDRSAVQVMPLEITVDAATGSSQLVASGPARCIEAGDDVSVGQPAWRHDGTLRFVSDRHRWWQPYRWNGSAGRSELAARGDDRPVALIAVQAEFHGPDWALGQSTMADLPDGSLVARMTSKGRDSIVRIDERTGTLRDIAQPCVAISSLCAHRDGVAYIGTSTEKPVSVWLLDGADIDAADIDAAGSERPRPVTLRSLADSAQEAPDVAVAEPFSFEGRAGRRIHGLVYRPTLRGVTGLPGTLPPLVVACHSGPTGSVGAGFDIVVQYFTSRGFAWAAVDYAGSTGYGRAYRCSLWGQWGVVDAQDCVDAARHLAAAGVGDARRMAVRGSSSGGLTALNALTDGGTFTAAASWYGVTDLLALAASTHDFEAHYLDRLVGPLPGSRETYLARSPVERAHEIVGAVLLLQGLDDPVVPPAQTERLRDALRAKGRSCTARFFEGESHGFRRAQTLRDCLEEELAFYRRELRL